MIPVADIISAGTGIINAVIVAHKIDVWARRLWRYGFSTVVTLLGSTGLALVKHTPVPVAAGIGMITAAGALLTLFMMDPDMKNMLIAVPPDVKDAATKEVVELVNKQ